MSQTPTRFSGPQQLTGAPVTQYTTPGSSIAVVRCFHVSNPSGGNIGLTLSIGADAAAVRLYDAYPIVPGAQDLFCYHPLAAAEIIQAWASSAGVLVLEISGDLRTP